jgi:origin recognition complex subunit 4
VRLNGLVHADDVTALKEMARQLRVHIAEDTAAGDSAAGDSAAAAGSAGPGEGNSAETLARLLAALRQGAANRAAAQGIVLVLDEFDLFAHTGKQTLLYALFDSVQMGSPLVVVGVTCRLDALTLLEKRVLSRFSKRQLFLFPEHSFEAYTAIYQRALTVAPDALPPQSIALVTRWNEHVAALAGEPGIERVMRTLYQTNRTDIRALCNFFFTAVVRAGGCLFFSLSLFFLCVPWFFYFFII